MIPPIIIKILGKDNLGAKLAQNQKKLQAFAKSAQSVGRSMTRYLTLPIVASAGLAVKASTNMNQAMARVGTLIPGNLKRLEELKKGVQDLSIETGKSTTELADGLFSVISAFQDSNETMGRLRVISRGAVGGITETASAVKLASIITKNYGDISAKAVQKVLDLSLQTNVLGETTFPELAESMARTVPFAKTLMVTQEELFGAMATFTGVAGNTSEVVTQLRSFLGALLKPTGEMTTAFKDLSKEFSKELGVKIKIGSGQELIEMLGLQGAMKALFKITEPYPGLLGEVLGRKEALNIVLASSGKLSEAFTMKTKAMAEAMGLSEKAFEEMTKGINKDGFAMKQLWRRVVILAQKFGDALVPSITKIIDKLIPLFFWLSNLSDKAKAFIIIAGLLTAAFGPLTAAVTTFAIVLNTAIWPVTLAVLAVIALSVAIAALVVWFEEIVNWFAKWGWAVALVTGPISWIIWGAALIIKYWDEIIAYFKDSWKWLKLIGTAIKNLDFGMLGKLISVRFGGGGAREFERREAAIGQEELNKRFGVMQPSPWTGKIELEYRGPPLARVAAEGDITEFDVYNRGPLFVPYAL